jgi:hypothetical protein
MEYRNFKNLHDGEKVIVSGLGQSATELKNPQDYFTIGVNDIGRIYQPNYLVVLNDKQTFLDERWEFIRISKCPTIFTHIKHLPIDDAQKCLIKLGRYGACELGKDQVDYTSNSPYVACMIAAYMGFRKIGLLGVDFTNHHFFKKSGEHSLARKVNVINKEYETMHRVLRANGIEFVNLSQESKITIPKVKLEDF